jgi:hypothetical protein
MVNKDFIQSYKDIYSYYYFDRYKLDDTHYDTYINYYLDIFKEITLNIDLKKNLNIVVKLKLLATKKRSEPWMYPIVVYKEYVPYGSGRILVDKFILNKENEKTILIAETPLSDDQHQIKSLDSLLACLNPTAKLYVEDGIIFSIYNILKNDTFESMKKDCFYKNKDAILEDIKNIDVSKFSNIVNYIKKPL